MKVTTDDYLLKQGVLYEPRRDCTEEGLWFLPCFIISSVLIMTLLIHFMLSSSYKIPIKSTKIISVL